MKKTTKNNLSKKIAKYGALSLAIAGVADASGQIIFTDVEPDFTSTAGGENFDLDIDGDGINEFIIENGGSFTQIDGGTLTGTIISQPNNGYNYALNFSEGTMIDASAAGFSFGSVGSLCYAAGFDLTFCGEDNSTPDGFAGISFVDVDGNTHFGWVRLEGVTSSTFTITEFAYEATPDTPIATGDGVLSLEDNTIEGFTSFVDTNNILNLNAQTPLSNISIYNITGQEVLSRSLSNTNETIDLNTLSTGVYIARVAVEGIETAIKFVKR